MSLLLRQLEVYLLESRWFSEAPLDLERPTTHGGGLSRTRVVELWGCSLNQSLPHHQGVPACAGENIRVQNT